MERAVITNKNTLALRGQIIGGILGGIGLTGSLVVAGLGYGWAGFGIAMTSVSGLVTTFVVGRESQKRERLKKEELRQQIKRGEPIEELEGIDSPVVEQDNESHQDTSPVPAKSPGHEVASPPGIGGGGRRVRGQRGVTGQGKQTPQGKGK